MDLMALMQCPECQHEVSTLAASCPNCGYLIRPQVPSLYDDPDLVHLVERERRRRELAPLSIVLAVMVLIVGIIVLASAANRAQSPPQYQICTQSTNWPPSSDGTLTSGSITISQVGAGTPCP